MSAEKAQVYRKMLALNRSFVLLTVWGADLTLTPNSLPMEDDDWAGAVRFLKFVLGAKSASILQACNSGSSFQWGNFKQLETLRAAQQAHRNMAWQSLFPLSSSDSLPLGPVPAWPTRPLLLPLRLKPTSWAHSLFLLPQRTHTPFWMSGWTVYVSYTGWTSSPSLSTSLSTRRRQRSSGRCPPGLGSGVQVGT